MQKIKDGFLESNLNRIFRDQGIYGMDLKIDCNVNFFDRGSRILRYVIGFGAGQTQAMAEFRVFDKEGTKIGNFNLTSNLYMGFFGGDADETFKYMSEEAAKIIKKRFLFK